MGCPKQKKSSHSVRNQKREIIKMFLMGYDKQKYWIIYFYVFNGVSET